jgi:SNW domain-containing protein 1
MERLSRVLPKPKYEHIFTQELDGQAPAAEEDQNIAQPSSSFEPPAYGSRQGFIPRGLEDFGDGGAFPEINVLQYPLDMGRKDKPTQGKIVPLNVDAEGHIKYDVILRQNMRRDQRVFGQFSDLIERDLSEDNLSRPSEEDQRRNTDKTRAALGQIVNQKIASAQPNSVEKEGGGAPTFIRYTPSQQGDSFNSGAQQRIIRLQEMPVDPLEPPKFKHKKVPGGPPSPPVPVMHSPPRKVTVEDQQAWRVPPSISNWKNLKGYTVPLDKRLVADGRGLLETQINDKFAKLSEALFIAERTARKEIETRQIISKKNLLKQREQREEDLRDLAAQARKGNLGAKRGAAADDRDAPAEEAPPASEKELDDLDDRESVRREVRRELRRDQRMEAKKQEKGRGSAAEKDRDVSEKIALGQKVAPSKDAQFDSRLFNQAEGLAQGFNQEENYDVYDKPLFKGSSASYIYRPKAGGGGDEEGTGDVSALLEKSTSKFKADRGFKGADGKPGGAGGGARSKPVEFEKEADPFNVGDLLNRAKSKADQDEPSKRNLDTIGKRNQMQAGSTGGLAGSGGKEAYTENTSHRRKQMEFTEASKDDEDERPAKRRR